MQVNNKYELPIPIPTEGINCIDDSLIADNEAAEGTKNISFKDGIPHTRPGYIKSSSFDFSASEPHTAYDYIKDGTRIRLVACGTTLKRQNGATFENITGALNSDYIECLTFPYKFADPDTFGDKCFILDSANYRYYDGVNGLTDVPAYAPTQDEIDAYGTNILSTNPDAIRQQKYILNDDERIWVGGNGKVVYISHRQKPDYFPSTQQWKLDENCTAMTRFMQEVIIFTDNTGTLISGKTPDWTLPEKYQYIKLPWGYGCKSHRSIAQGNNAVYWANGHGVYRYRLLPDGNTIPECISEFKVRRGSKIHTRTIKKLLKNITDWTKVFAVFYDNEYRLCLGNEKWLIYDTIRGTWAYYEYAKAFNCGYVSDETLYCFKDYMYHMEYPYDPVGETWDGLNDDGTAIDTDLKTKFFSFNKDANLKKFKKLHVTCYSELVSYNILLRLNIDNEYTTLEGEIVNTISRFGEMRFGDRIQVRETNLNYPVKIKHKGKKYNIQFEFICYSGWNMAYTLLSMVLKLDVKELD